MFVWDLCTTKGPQATVASEDVPNTWNLDRKNMADHPPRRDHPVTKLPHDADNDALSGVIHWTFQA